MSQAPNDTFTLTVEEKDATLPMPPQEGSSSSSAGGREERETAPGVLAKACEDEEAAGETVQLDRITDDVMARSLSILGHNSLGQVVFSCSTLSGLGLVDISKLSGYRYLQKIILDNNKLTTLDALRPLEYLVYLSANNNQLTEDCFDCLQRSSSNLEHLALNKNALRSLNGLHRYPYLINFSAAGNQITELRAQNFSTAKSLMRVELRNNQIGSVEPHTFAGAQHIRVLDLSHNKVEDVLFTTYISENLQSLYLSDNCITRLGRSLSECLCLVVLDLKGNRITSIEELQNICPAPALRKLYVTGNPFKEMQEDNSTDAEVEAKLNRSEITMDDTVGMGSGYQPLDGSGYSAAEPPSTLEEFKKNLKTPNLPYAALTARSMFGKIQGVITAANVLNIPSQTNKLGELQRMPLPTQARLRVLNFLPHLTVLNGVLVTSEDVARSIAYFEEEKPYFPERGTRKSYGGTGNSIRDLSQPPASQISSEELNSPPRSHDSSSTQSAL